MWGYVRSLTSPHLRGVFQHGGGPGGANSLRSTTWPKKVPRQEARTITFKGFLGVHDMFPFCARVECALRFFAGDLAREMEDTFDNRASSLVVEDTMKPR